MSEEKKIPAGWEETTLNAVAEIKYGKDHKHLKDGNIPCLGSGGLMRFVDEILYDKPSVLIPRKGTISNLFFIDEPFWTVDTLFYTKINENKIIPKYLYFKLKTINLENMDVGSAIPSLTTAVLNQIEIVIPKDIEEQKSIAEILTSFDNKIELLQTQNKTLEEMAQTIFVEWFGKFSVNEELPDEWRVEELDELLELIIDYRGKTPLKLGLDWSENGIPAISAKSIKNGKIVRRDAMNFGSEELYSVWMKDELEKGDVLLTSEAPLGEMYYFNDDTKYILSQRVFALRVNKKITSEYLFHYLFSEKGQALLQARASGSTVEGIRQSELRKVEIIVPEKEILNKASKIFKTVFDKIFINEEQIQSLVKTRDELLPRLMSGAVRVKGN